MNHKVNKRFFFLLFCQQFSAKEQSKYVSFLDKYTLIPTQSFFFSTYVVLSLYGFLSGPNGQFVSLTYPRVTAGESLAFSLRPHDPKRIDRDEKQQHLILKGNSCTLLRYLWASFCSSVRVLLYFTFTVWLTCVVNATVWVPCFPKDEQAVP